MSAPRFTRLGSSNVLAQAHVSEDSRFMLLPIIGTGRHGAWISGWQVYDAVAGKMLVPQADEKGAPRDGVWAQLHMAREWVIHRYYQQGSAHQ